MIRIVDPHKSFGPKQVLRGVHLEIDRGETMVVIGQSGSGKSVLLKHIIGMLKPDSGRVFVDGVDITALRLRELQPILRKFGMLFQGAALFDSLTVAENVGVPLREHTRLGPRLVAEIAALKIALAGLPADAGAKRPAELSGGMRKRAALARALALDPELVFLDEPTAGLDPLSASGFDELVRHLRELLGLTVVVVSHDLDLLWRVADRVAFMVEGRVAGVGTMAELSHSAHPLVREYFYGPRGRAAWEQAWKRK